MGHEEAFDRLFTLGYEGGKTFVEAVHAGKVDERDISQSIAIGLGMSMSGPSVDFILGRFWEIVAESYLDKFYEACPNCIRDDELAKLKAEKQFHEMNCALLE